MGLTVHGDICSPFVKIAAMTIYEKNEDFELVFARLSLLKTEEFLAKNPFGRMPVLEDGDLVVFESRAVARYVEAKFEGQGTPLMPANLKEQALVNIWAEVESQSFCPPVWAICSQFLSKKVPDVSVIEASREKLEKVLDIYEIQLSKRKYLAGDFFSLADLFHIPLLHILQCLSEDIFRSVINSRTYVHKWHQDITNRPSWKRIISVPEASDWSFLPKV
ncbi:hypothetical protein R1sor_011533 [Riccia sorocarpa]|uniref:glutathione transferase n=1 Tax=Riccia sorocarpa TaxID=122646 RepID=A0ABD3I148_9MARC